MLIDWKKELGNWIEPNQIAKDEKDDGTHKPRGEGVNWFWKQIKIKNKV